jgi:hypothetical protein
LNSGAQPTGIETDMTTVRSRLLIGAVLLVVSSCGGAPPEPPFAVATDEPLPSLGPTTDAAPTATATPEPVPSLGENELAIGDTATITRAGEPWAELTITEVRVDASYPEPGPAAGGDTPRVDHDFVAANVTLTARAEPVTFELAHLRATLETGEPIEITFSHLGPKPELLPATVEPSASVSGWIIYEAPKVGRVRLAYDDGSATTEPFSFVLRAD